MMHVRLYIPKMSPSLFQEAHIALIRPLLAEATGASWAFRSCCERQIVVSGSINLELWLYITDDLLIELELELNNNISKIVRCIPNFGLRANSCHVTYVGSDSNYEWESSNHGTKRQLTVSTLQLVYCIYNRIYQNLARIQLVTYF